MSTSFGAASGPFLLSLSHSLSLSVCACVRAPCLMTLNDYKIVHFEHGRNGRHIPGMWAKTKANRNCILLKAISTWRQNAPKKERTRCEAVQSDGRWEEVKGGGGGDC